MEKIKMIVWSSLVLSLFVFTCGEHQVTEVVPASELEQKAVTKTTSPDDLVAALAPNFTLVAQNNTPISAIPFPGNCQTIKTLNFTLSQNSRLLFDYNQSQVHNNPIHQELGIKIILDGTEEVSTSRRYINGAALPRVAGHYVIILGETVGPGNHTVDVQICDTGENGFFRIFAKDI